MKTTPLARKLRVEIPIFSAPMGGGTAGPALTAAVSSAGGHVRGTTSLSALLPGVVAAVPPLPVLAAGGIATGAGVAAARALRKLAPRDAARSRRATRRRAR